MRLYRFVLIVGALVLVSRAAKASCSPNGSLQDCTDSVGNPGEQACIQGDWTPCETITSWYVPGDGCGGTSSCPEVANATGTCVPESATSQNWCQYTCAAVPYWEYPEKQWGGTCIPDDITNSYQQINGLSAYSNPFSAITVQDLSSLQPNVAYIEGASYVWSISGGVFADTGTTTSGGNNSTLQGYNTVSIAEPSGFVSGVVTLSVIAFSPWGEASMIGGPQTLNVVSVAGQPVLSARDGYASASTPSIMVQINTWVPGDPYTCSASGGAVTSQPMGRYAFVAPDFSENPLVVTCTDTNTNLQGSLSLPVYTATPTASAVQFQPVQVGVGATFVIASVPNRGNQFQANYSWSAVSGASYPFTVLTPMTSFAYFNVTGDWSTPFEVSVNEQTQDWNLTSYATTSIDPWPRDEPAIYLPAVATSGATVAATTDAVDYMTYQWSIDGGTIVGPPSGVTSGGTNTVVFNISAAAGSPFALSVEEVNGAGISGVPGVASATATAPNLSVTISNATGPTTTVSSEGTYTASAPATSGNSYAWTIDDGTILSQSTTEGTTQATFVPTVPVGGNVVLTATSSGASPQQGSASATIGAALPPAITVGQVVSAGQLIELAAEVPSQVGATYSWSILGGQIPPGQNGPLITFTTNAPATDFTLMCTVTYPDGTVASGSLTTSLQAMPDATITLPPVIAAGAVGLEASVPQQSGAIYEWGIDSGGTITTPQANQDAPTINFNVTGAAGSVLAGC